MCTAARDNRRGDPGRAGTLAGYNILTWDPRGFGSSGGTVQIDDPRYEGRDTQALIAGPRFAWVDENGTWRDSSQFPLDRAGTLRGSKSGTWPLLPGAAGVGGVIFATLAPDAFKVPIPGPESDADIVGVPQLTVTYSGTGAPTRTDVYAQIVDPRRNIVVGNVPTPVPLRLDGKRRTLELPLEPIASRAPAGGGYELQITSSTTVYDIQRSTGLINFADVDVTLPVSKPR